METYEAPGFKKYPDYKIEISRSGALHQIIFNEAVIAASDKALIVKEGQYAPVIYFPPESIEQRWFRATQHHTHCPFKGDASYWTVHAYGARENNAAWSYSDPFKEVDELKGYVAFHMDRMTCYWRDGVEQPLSGTALKNAA